MRMRALTLMVLSGAWIALGVFIERAAGTCANQGVTAQDPAPTQVNQYCNDTDPETASWICPLTITDIQAYQACGPAQSHAGYQCDTQGYAQQIVYTYGCGETTGTCTGPSQSTGNSSFQHHVENPCPPE